MVRLLVFLGLNVSFATAAVVTWVILKQPIVSAAIIGAWPVFLIAIYDRFVNAPTLQVLFDAQNPDVSRPSLTMLPQRAVWNFLRVFVRNSGFSVARNCTAELRVLQRPSRGGQVCPTPADEPKGLIWAGKNPGQPCDIPRKGEAILNVLLDDTSITQAARTGWHLAHIWGPLTAWAATHDVFLLGPLQRAQDAFCQGTYIVEITVFPENGTPKSGRYHLTVNSNWGNVTLNRAPLRHSTIHVVKRKFYCALALYLAISLVLMGSAIGGINVFQVPELKIALVAIWATAALLEIVYTQVLDRIDLLGSRDQYNDLLGGQAWSRAGEEKAKHKRALRWVGVSWAFIVAIVATIIKIWEVINA